MSRHYIKYPVAYNVSSKLPVPISEVTIKNRAYLICPECKNNLIGVIKHRTPHFRHKPHTACSGSPETYLHWLTKEVFKQITEIDIPELLIDDLPEKHRQDFQARYNKIVFESLPETFIPKFRKSLKSNLSECRTIIIEKIETEKEYKTELGKVRIDIIITTKNKQLFIEPFFSNPINKVKIRKLSDLNIATISIDLKIFLEHYKQDYSIENLKDYLSSKKSKKWSYLSNAVYDKHISNYMAYVLEEIKEYQEIIDLHKSKLIEISNLEHKLEIQFELIKNAQQEIHDLEVRISTLKRNLETDS